MLWHYIWLYIKSASYLILHMGTCMNCRHGKYENLWFNPLIMNSWILWNTRKFKDAYLLHSNKSCISPYAILNMMCFSYIIIYNRATTQYFLRKHSSTNNFPKCVWPKNKVYATWLFSKNPIKKLFTVQPTKSLTLQVSKEIS